MEAAAEAAQPAAARKRGRANEEPGPNNKRGRSHEQEEPAQANGEPPTRRKKPARRIPPPARGVDRRLHEAMCRWRWDKVETGVFKTPEGTLDLG